MKMVIMISYPDFKKVIDKVSLSADKSISSKSDWVVEVDKPIKTGKGKNKIIKDYKLSRYICYLIIQNIGLSKKSYCFRSIILCCSN